MHADNEVGRRGILAEKGETGNPEQTIKHQPQKEKERRKEGQHLKITAFES